MPLSAVGVNGFTNSTWVNWQPYIEGGGLSGRYHLEQIHLHWNKRGNGSEHTVDGRRYPAEVHLVHSKDGVHPASDALDKFAVVAVFLEESEDANQPLEEQFFSRLSKVYVVPDEVDGVITFTDLRADVFLPANRRKFYRYDGSLTTPNCDEDVVWTIMQDAVNVSKEQLDELRQVVMREDNPFKNNTRPAHALNGRKVLRNF
ncbi:carbonic anhydrase [Aphelenchoides avenae]|nr:carbonic anhydrase [Aphelenchus avenae]